MKKKDLKKEMAELAAQIKANSKDAAFADKLIKSLLSVKGQIDIEPAELHIAEKEVLKRYDFSSYEYIRCKSCVIFHIHGGVFTVVKPTMAALYDALVFLLDNIDNKEQLSDDLKNTLDTLQNAYAYILQAPIVTSLDDEALNDIAIAVVKSMQRVQDRYLQEDEAREETEDDFIKNARFENEQNMLNSSLEDGKDA